MGVESAVALKNAYALGVALAVGAQREGQRRGLHAALQFAGGDVLPERQREIRKLLTYLTGNDRQIDSAAGDMYVTIFGGRTRLIGTLLGRGYGIDEALAELKGVTLESLVIIGPPAVDFPPRVRSGIHGLQLSLRHRNHLLRRRA